MLFLAAFATGMAVVIDLLWGAFEAVRGSYTKELGDSAVPETEQTVPGNRGAEEDIVRRHPAGCLFSKREKMAPRASNRGAMVQAIR